MMLISSKCSFHRDGHNFPVEFVFELEVERLEQASPLPGHAAAPEGGVRVPGHGGGGGEHVGLHPGGGRGLQPLDVVHPGVAHTEAECEAGQQEEEAHVTKCHECHAGEIGVD